MKVIRLSAENIKRIKAVEVIPDPDGNLVIISGKNNQGKTSALDAITYTLCGKKAIPTKPLRDGADKGATVVETEEFIATRKFTKKGDTLTVKTHKGTKYPTPQKFLDGLVGKLSFDPLEFSRMSDPDRREALVDLAGIREELEAWQGNHDAWLEQYRTEVADSGAAGKTLKGMRAPEEGDPTKLTDMAYLVDRMAVISNAGAKLAIAEQDEGNAEGLRLSALTEYQTARDRLSELKDEAIKQKKHHIQTQEDLVLAQDTVNTLGSADDLQTRLLNVEEHNGVVKGNEEYLEQGEKVAKAEKRQENAKAKITESHDKKAELFAAAKLPVKGLSIDDGEVTFKGNPFNQLSASMQLKVSLAMAMAANPELRVIRINDGSLLDKASMKVIEKMAKKKDFQLWIEVVSEDDGIGFVIEDGEVKS